MTQRDEFEKWLSGRFGVSLKHLQESRTVDAEGVEGYHSGGYLNGIVCSGMWQAYQAGQYHDTRSWREKMLDIFKA